MRYTIAICSVVFLLPFVAFAHTYGSNVLTAGLSCSQDSTVAAGYDCSKSIDGNTATLWESSNGAGYHWVSYDLGAANSKSAGQLTLLYNDPPNDWNVKDFTFQYSDDNSTWVSIATSTRASSTAVESFNYDDTTPHRYFRILAETSYNATTPFYSGFNEVTLAECTDCVAASSSTSTAVTAQEYFYKSGGTLFMLLTVLVVLIIIFTAAFLVSYVLL